jgi:hypothetical protein
MKNPTYATFMNEVESLISELKKDDLVKIILNLADKQSIASRNQFLQNIKEDNALLVDTDQVVADIPAGEFIAEVKEYEQRVFNGDFFDEEENYRAYERTERSFYSRKNDYYDKYDDEFDFANEEYVLEAVALLDKAKKFFRQHDINTAFTAYDILFNIFDNPDFYAEEGYFVFGFSFGDAIDSEVLKEHKTIYHRCQYLHCKNIDDFNRFYCALAIEHDIFLTDVIEVDRKPLPDLDNFLNGYIHFLSKDARYDAHLIDALYVKGRMDEIRAFAYAEGNTHPAVFIHYYNCEKENRQSQSDLSGILLDGIELIPEHYRIRSCLGEDLVKIAKESRNKNHLLIGYSTAFYSNPSLRNFAYYTDFILTENIETEIEKLSIYLRKQPVESPDDWRRAIDDYGHRNIYALESAEIDIRALIVGGYIFNGIESLVDIINPRHFLGFQSKSKHVAIVSALALRSIAGKSDVRIADKLVDYYCLDITSDEYELLNKMLSDHYANYPMPEELVHKTLKKIESLAVNRVSHILGNKLRGGYESACLLLVACAEVKQLVTRDGHILISDIDNKFKKFSAFRKPLKNLTSQSRHLLTVK